MWWWSSVQGFVQAQIFLFIVFLYGLYRTNCHCDFIVQFLFNHLKFYFLWFYDLWFNLKNDSSSEFEMSSSKSIATLNIRIQNCSIYCTWKKIIKAIQTIGEKPVKPYSIWKPWNSIWKSTIEMNKCSTTRDLFITSCPEVRTILNFEFYSNTKEWTLLLWKYDYKYNQNQNNEFD